MSRLMGGRGVLHPSFSIPLEELPHHTDTLAPSARPLQSPGIPHVTQKNPDEHQLQMRGVPSHEGTLSLPSSACCPGSPGGFRVYSTAVDADASGVWTPDFLFQDLLSLSSFLTHKLQHL